MNTNGNKDPFLTTAGIILLASLWNIPLLFEIYGSVNLLFYWGFGLICLILFQTIFFSQRLRKVFFVESTQRRTSSVIIGVQLIFFLCLLILASASLYGPQMQQSIEALKVSLNKTA